MLRDFVREALARGESRDAIADALEKAGWPQDQARDALASFAEVDFSVPVPRPRRFGGAREAFLYIVFFSLLGMVALQSGRLAFAYIDFQFADPLTRETHVNQLARLRWAIASLIVGYPIFLYLGWRLGAAYRNDPERRVSRIRVWLTYITLIFAALTLIGDLVAVVYNFLGGEMTARFVFKALVVALISGAILFTYARDAERTATGVDWPSRLVAGAATLGVVLLVLWAALRVDTPAAARARAFDEQRLAGLVGLARSIDCYKTYFGEMPANTSEVQSALRARAAQQPVAGGCSGELPDDPRTSAPYPYERLGDDRFRLCAVFERGWSEDEIDDNTPEVSVRIFPDSVRRTLRKPISAGEACFEFEAIDFEDDAE